jgi:hypothetical protein
VGGRLHLKRHFSEKSAASPSAAGAGLLLVTGTDINIALKRIRKIKTNEKQKTILPYAGFGENIEMF